MRQRPAKALEPTNLGHFFPSKRRIMTKIDFIASYLELDPVAPLNEILLHLIQIVDFSGLLYLIRLVLSYPECCVLFGYLYLSVSVSLNFPDCSIAKTPPRDRTLESSWFFPTDCFPLHLKTSIASENPLHLKHLAHMFLPLQLHASIKSIFQPHCFHIYLSNISQIYLLEIIMAQNHNY